MHRLIVSLAVVACGQSAMPQPTPVPTAPVSAEALAALLPDVAGWTRKSTRSEVVVKPVAYARAQAHYQKGESTIELVITDSGLQPLVLEPVKIFLAPGFDERSGGTHRTAVTIGGSPGSETWAAGSRRGEVTVLVANRFIVAGTGLEIGSLDSVRAVVRAVSFSRLAALK